MAVNFTIRELHDMHDLAATVDLQQVVWRMRAHECSSPHTMKAAAHTGGCVLGAEADGRLIGFCFGMAGRREGEIWLWSHMTAVHPDYQGGGIGFALKQAQRAMGAGARLSRHGLDLRPAASRQRQLQL